MPSGLLSSAPRVALFGKLPTHGDFVRRGDPALVQRLDAWLTTGISQLADAEIALDERLASLPMWCFRLRGDIAGAVAASCDKVGRVHPVIACGGARVSPEEVATALVKTRDRGGTADGLYTSLVELATASAPNGLEGDRTGWWRIGEEADPNTDGTALPQGGAFARLFGVKAASCPG